MTYKLKIIYTLSLIMCVIATSCSKTEDFPLPVPDITPSEGHEVVLLYAGASRSQTRLQVDFDADKTGKNPCLKTTWTEGDKVYYEYRHNDEIRGTVLKFVQYCDHNKDHKFAIFAGEVPDGDGDDFYENPYAAVCVQEDGCVRLEAHASNSYRKKIVVDLSTQRGRADELHKYDLLYANNLRGSTVNNHKIVKFHHFMNILHFKLKTGVCQGYKIKTLNMNNMPGIIHDSKSANGYKGVHDTGLFVKEMSINELHNPKEDYAYPCVYEKSRYTFFQFNQKIEENGEKKDSEPLYYLSCHPSYEQDKQNVITFGEDSLAHVFFVTPMLHTAGRISLQLLAEKDGDEKILSSSFLVKSKGWFGNIYEPKGSINMDKDNAIGMFLYKKGGYGPLFRKNIFGENVDAIAVCTSNKTEKDNIKYNGTSLVFDSRNDAMYNHYAMALTSYQSQFFADTKNLKEDKWIKPYWTTDCNSNKKGQNGWMSRYGRQYFLNYIENKEKFIFVDKMPKEFYEVNKSYISYPFIPASGQMYQAVCNLSVPLISEGENARKLFSSEDLKKMIEKNVDGESNALCRNEAFVSSTAFLFLYYSGLRGKLYNPYIPPKKSADKSV